MAQFSMPKGINRDLLLRYLKNRRIIAVLTSLVLLFLLFLLNTSYSPIYPVKSISSYLPPITSITNTPAWSSPESLTNSASAGTFWPQFYAALLAATPRCALPHHHIEAAISRFSPGSGMTYHQDLIQLDPVDEAEITAAHTWFVSQITSPSFPRAPFVPGSSGVVTSAGGEFLPEALVAIRMLRRTGSTLPVDVFLATPEEAEGNICDTVMPALGARCIILSSVLGDFEGNLPHRLELSKYQLKAFALLLSEFDNVLWIDADQMPLVDPLELLTGEPLRSKGLVTWPDYWYPTTSPLYFRIANISLPFVPSPGDRAASETGQLLFSKSTSSHISSLELAAYYAFHGPSHYFKLLSQGAVGEGDKETFLAAAMALQQDFYTVQSGVDTIGWRGSDGMDWFETGMLQAHPGLDYARSGSKGGVVTEADDASAPRVSPAFLHSEQHKPNAGRYSKLWRASVRQRMWQPTDEMITRFGFDIERASWDEMVWTACGDELGGHVFADWIDNPTSIDYGPEVGSVCDQAKSIYVEMFGEAWVDFKRLREGNWGNVAPWQHG